MEVYKLHSTLLGLLILYITIKVATAFSVTFIQNSDEETKLMFHEPAVHHGENVRDFDASSRFTNLRKNIKRDRSHSGKRARRAIIVRCCGMDTCSPTARRQQPSGSSRFLAYAKLTFDGVSISCPNCPKGWEGNLKWSWSTRGIPIVCKDCPHNWENLLSINEGRATTPGDTTDEEETEETDATDETDEPTTVKGKKTTAKVTTKATNTTVTTTQTTKAVTNATVTPTVVANTTVVQNATTKAATTAAASGGGGFNLGGLNLGSLGSLLG